MAHYSRPKRCDAGNFTGFAAKRFSDIRQKLLTFTALQV